MKQDEEDYPNFFESTSKTIKIKNYENGTVYPFTTDSDSSIFYLDSISGDINELFSVGLVIRMNEKPMYLATERLMEHEELNSFD